jgi:ABC-type uncharacterized transport system substrate-binding protein
MTVMFTNVERASIPPHSVLCSGIMSKSLLRPIVFALTGLVATCAVASAHPHVWVTMKAQVVYAPDGSVTGVRHSWTFDDMFSVFATQGIDTKTKGEFTRDELKPLAQTNVESLKDFDYFTYAKSNGKKLEFAEPLGDYYLDYDSKETVLTLHFTLPLKKPLKAKEVTVEVFDPSYFVDFSFVKDDPVGLIGAPPACKVSSELPKEMDAAMLDKLAQMPADAQLDPSSYLGSQFAYKIQVKCP